MMGSFPKSKFEFISDDLALDFLEQISVRNNAEFIRLSNPSTNGTAVLARESPVPFVAH